MSKTRIQISSDGDDVVLTIFSLKTDSWRDYKDFLDDAKAADAAGDLRSRNRFLRAGIFNLFAHFEAFVEEVREAENLANPHDSLHKKSKAIHDCLKKLGHKLPALNIGFSKAIRDIIAHPSLKYIRTGEQKEVNQTMVYDTLSVEMLTELGNRIAFWSKAVARYTKRPRLSKTLQAVKSLSTQLGKPDEIKDI
jgi:hypothetical protein